MRLTASAYLGLYAQDDWKVARKLTVNLGLRYDVDVPRTERYNRLNYYDLNAPSPLAGKVPGFPNLKGAMVFRTPDHRHQVPTDMNNWGPRIGFAYNITPKTVFRGAYGILYSGSVLQAAGTSGSSGTEGFQSNDRDEHHQRRLQDDRGHAEQSIPQRASTCPGGRVDGPATGSTPNSGSASAIASSRTTTTPSFSSGTPTCSGNCQADGW